MFGEDNSPTTPTRPKGSMTLLEKVGFVKKKIDRFLKIRAKEQESKLQAMLNDKGTIERKNRIDFIKSKLLMVICSEYSLKQKSSMELPHLVTRLQVSNQSMTQG